VTEEKASEWEKQTGKEMPHRSRGKGHLKKREQIEKKKKKTQIGREAKMDLSPVNKVRNFLGGTGNVPGGEDSELVRD